ncbi:hypothetical protein OIE66_17750 [Nonomuraea sp. NBC_01738]|nr:hypothetical protein OIE66_17750 [Nonomuraea sp. NBC_01738]
MSVGAYGRAGCVDKTGTLTEGRPHLVAALDDASDPRRIIHTSP